MKLGLCFQLAHFFLEHLFSCSMGGCVLPFPSRLEERSCCFLSNLSAAFRVFCLVCRLVQDLIKETKRRFKFMNHQIEQLKDEITVMDHCLVCRLRLVEGGGGISSSRLLSELLSEITEWRRFLVKTWQNIPGTSRSEKV